MRYENAASKLKDFSQLYLRTRTQGDYLRVQGQEILEAVMDHHKIRAASLASWLGVNRSYIGRILNADQTISVGSLAALGSALREWEDREKTRERVGKARATNERKAAAKG